MSDGEFQIPDELRRRIESGEDLFPQKTARAKEMLSKYGLPEQLKTKKENMTGVQLIENERLEHKLKHGKSVKHDFEAYKDKELVQAAIGLLLGNPLFMPESWSEEQCGNMLNKSYVDRLVIAGSLIAAQIDVENYKEND